MNRPRVGLSVASLNAIPGVTRPYQGTAQHYTRALWEAGVTPVMLPLIPEAAEELLSGLDGLVLSGGVDVNPALYGETPDPRLGEVDDLRDATETRLYRVARERGLPVLGICRGVQIINVLEGGTLAQHVDGHSQTLDGHAYDDVTHDVTFEAASGLLARLHPEVTRVNSHHHQVVQQVAPTLRVAARSADGLVEALEGDGIVAVQWHPEATFERAPDTNGTFRALVEMLK